MYPNSITYTIPSGGLLQTIDLSQLVDEYFITSNGVQTLSGSVSINPIGTATGDLTIIRWGAKLLLNGNTVNVFGKNLDQEMVMQNLRIEAKYDVLNSQWDVVILEDASGFPFGVAGVKKTTLDGTNNTINLVWGIDCNVQRFVTLGVLTLAAGITISGSGTPIAGAKFVLIWDAKCTYSGGNTVTLGDVMLSALESVSGLVIAETTFDGTNWITQVLDRYGIDKFRILGDSGDTVPDFLQGKIEDSIAYDNTNKKIHLQGDPPTIADGYWGLVGSVYGFYPMPAAQLLQATLTIQHADILLLNGTPLNIIASPGAGLAIDVIHASIQAKGLLGVFTPYTTNTKLLIITDTAGDEQLNDSTALVTNTDFTLNGMVVHTPAVSPPSQLVANKGVNIMVAGANPGGGLAGNTITFNVMYRIIPII